MGLWLKVGAAGAVVTNEFEHHFNQIADPLDSRFTRADLAEFMARLARHEPCLRLAACQGLRPQPLLSRGSLLPDRPRVGPPALLRLLLTVERRAGKVALPQPTLQEGGHMAIELDEAASAALEAELVPMGTLWASFGDIHTIEGAPFGTRLIVDVTDVRIEGERLNARMKGQATADWGSLAADGTFQLDVRATLETNDGALILAQYNGRCDFSNPEAPGPVYSAPRFETGDPRYTWLNKVQAVMKGKVELPTHITYRIYEVR